MKNVKLSEYELKQIIKSHKWDLGLTVKEQLELNKIKDNKGVKI
jgi:hypothetical protein